MSFFHLKLLYYVPRRLCFKGANKEEEAVLCSNNHTFAVKSVETTNLVLLVEDSGVSFVEDNREISGETHLEASAIVTSHLELVPIAPKFDSLDKYLADNSIAYENELHIDELSQRLVAGKTWDELYNIVPASAEELKRALLARNAIYADGKWRGIDQRLIDHLFELLMLTCTEQGWNLSSIPVATAAKHLSEYGYPHQLTRYVIQKFSNPPGSISDATYQKVETIDEGCLNNDAICLYFGIKLLKQKPQWDALPDFMGAWSDVVPEGLTPAIDLLRGEALIIKSSGSQGIERFSVRDLPPEAPDRFSKLFMKRVRWEYDELEPYIRSLTGPGETVETLLLKYARASQQKPSDPVTYSAR